MITSFLANTLVVLIVVAFHYEALRQIGIFFQRFNVLAQFRIGLAVLLSLIAHSIESLTGLVLITWTASFLYVKMTRYWTDL